MKTEQEIKTQLGVLQSSDVMQSENATVDINAPLALMQVAAEAKVEVLEWVLSKGGE